MDCMNKPTAEKATICARRSTFDGKHVLLWSDGSLTWALGNSIKGSAFPRTPEQVEQALRAGWLVLGEVGIYDADEVSDLVAAARKAVAKNIGALPGDVRDEAEAARKRAAASAMPGGWHVYHTGYDGKPTCRVWRFPRLSPQYGRFAIWHERGRYEVMLLTRGTASNAGTRNTEDVLEPTGSVYATLGEAFAGVRAMAPESITVDVEARP